MAAQPVTEWLAEVDPVRAEEAAAGADAGTSRSLTGTSVVPVYHLMIRWYTDLIPTAHPRYQVTETPAIARAIDRAAMRWPGEPRSKLLLRLVDVGSETLEQHEKHDVEVHRAAVTASSGAYPDAFGPDYLVELRKDWPA